MAVVVIVDDVCRVIPQWATADAEINVPSAEGDRNIKSSIFNPLTPTGSLRDLPGRYCCSLTGNKNRSTCTGTWVRFYTNLNSHLSTGRELESLEG